MCKYAVIKHLSNQISISIEIWKYTKIWSKYKQSLHFEHVRKTRLKISPDFSLAQLSTIHLYCAEIWKLFKQIMLIIESKRLEYITVIIIYFKSQFRPQSARVRWLPDMRSLYISLNTAHSGCKPCHHLHTSFTHSSPAPAPVPTPAPALAHTLLPSHLQISTGHQYKSIIAK